MAYCVRLFFNAIMNYKSGLSYLAHSFAGMPTSAQLQGPPATAHWCALVAHTGERASRRKDHPSQSTKGAPNLFSGQCPPAELRTPPEQHLERFTAPQHHSEDQASNTRTTRDRSHSGQRTHLVDTLVNQINERLLEKEQESSMKMNR